MLSAVDLNAESYFGDKEVENKALISFTEYPLDLKLTWQESLDKPIESGLSRSRCPSHIVRERCHPRIILGISEPTPLVWDW
jgi:hypothetical protein